MQKHVLLNSVYARHYDLSDNYLGQNVCSHGGSFTSHQSSAHENNFALNSKNLKKKG